MKLQLALAVAAAALLQSSSAMNMMNLGGGGQGEQKKEGRDTAPANFIPGVETPTTRGPRTTRAPRTTAEPFIIATTTTAPTTPKATTPKVTTPTIVTFVPPTTTTGAAGTTTTGAGSIFGYKCQNNQCVRCLVFGCESKAQCEKTCSKPKPAGYKCMLGGNQCVKCDAGDTGCVDTEAECSKNCKPAPEPTTTTVKPAKDLYKCVGGSRHNGGGMCVLCNEQGGDDCKPYGQCMSSGTCSSYRPKNLFKCVGGSAERGGGMCVRCNDDGRDDPTCMPYGQCMNTGTCSPHWNPFPPMPCSTCSCPWCSVPTTCYTIDQSLIAPAGPTLFCGDASMICPSQMWNGFSGLQQADAFTCQYFINPCQPCAAQEHVLYLLEPAKQTTCGCLSYGVTTQQTLPGMTAAISYGPTVGSGGGVQVVYNTSAPQEAATAVLDSSSNSSSSTATAAPADAAQVAAAQAASVPVGNVTATTTTTTTTAAPVAA